MTLLDTRESVLAELTLTMHQSHGIWITFTGNDIFTKLTNL